ncbi:RNA-binding (RRM/RBD/RNP motifs) family protein [Zea mays]|uniref:RNA-binding (RRM/RBD/RNP motifs) family protein n=1 Tax=Zea mays TaxID=4577 RepID=A0A1D6QQY1_MAIZE|nr:RNA-binding (RRM/RBD/RNP motifs) family protein [Zea mays]
MAVDEVNSVYVGSLPYEANEEMLRDAFGYYGTIVSVKVINDHTIKGKCYGFVTFTHPRAAEQAIAGMDGKKLGNRIIRVNEVRTRGPRDFGRDGFRRDPRRYGRDPYWDRRDREQSYDRERDPYHDRDSDRSREHDRERDYEHGGFNREVDYPMDRDHEVDDIHPREHDRAAETHNMDSDNDKYKEHGSRKSHPKGRDSKDLSSSSDLQNDVSAYSFCAIVNGLARLRIKSLRKVKKKNNFRIKLQKLEDELAAARKVSSERQLAVTDLYKHFLQLQDYNDRVKTAEHRLQSLVDAAMAELDMAEDATTRDGSMYENGVV